MTDMTKGIKVIGCESDGGAIVEIEFFYGLDVNQLDDIPNFAQNLTETQAFWPQDEGKRHVTYRVARARCEPNLPDEVRLKVTYKQEQNPKIVQRFQKANASHYHLWGTNTFVFRPGSTSGQCEWQGTNGDSRTTDQWESFDLGAGRARRPSTTNRMRRDAEFRDMILSADGYRCVLTEETTIKALDAAHLIPAAKGENDVPPNGVTLRADLHRLFDANLFTFDPEGQVVIGNDGELSETYRGCLQNRWLPPRTLERVRATLALPKFRDRPPAR